jgi:hypothetical protein
MWTHQPSTRYPRLRLLIVLVILLVGLVVGFAAGTKTFYIGLALVALPTVAYFFGKFEQAVISLLILRSSLDLFSARQVPAAFAIGLDLLTLLYVIVMLLTGKSVRTDRFWWFLAGWIALQGMWVVLLPLQGLGLDSSLVPDALGVGIREWVRLFSWLMVYLLVMQLKDRVAPEKMVNALFLSLIMPLTAGLMQVVIPPAHLPSILVSNAEGSFDVSSRVNGTLGHPATFATFLLLFIGLTCWKLGQARYRLPWILLLGVLAFFLVSTKAMTVLGMLCVLLIVLTVPRFNLITLFGGILLFAVVIGLFASTEFGQERLSSIMATPLLNPHIDIWRAIVLSWSDNNSFNWRLAQWTFLIQAWQNSPILGYGLNTSPYLTVFNLYAHNDYVRALAEEGIIGLIAFLVFLGAQFIRILQLIFSSPLNSSHRSFCMVLLGIFCGLLLGMANENIFSHTTLFFYWWLLLAVAGWDWNQQGLGKHQSRGIVPV